MIFRVADQNDRGRIMKKITDVKPQVKTPTRCNIYLDNAFYCGLELETVMRHRLKIGDEISPGRLDEIQAESESLRALDKALGFISRSQKTKKQVADYLVRKGYTEKTIEVVLGKMSAYKFVNDQNYSNEYFRQASKYKGKRLIYSELKRKPPRALPKNIFAPRRKPAKTRLNVTDICSRKVSITKRRKKRRTVL